MRITSSFRRTCQVSKYNCLLLRIIHTIWSVGGSRIYATSLYVILFKERIHPYHNVSLVFSIISGVKLKSSINGLSGITRWETNLSFASHLSYVKTKIPVWLNVTSEFCFN